MIGQTVGNHKIVELIGEGGMGTVFLAEHERLGRKVAIKMLHPHLVRDPALRARFKNEAALLARLQHRNIVTLYDYVEDEDSLFLVMEYVQGRDLDDLVRNEYGPFPLPLLKQVFEQVLDALGYAHSQKIIHRDIKPSNFILNSDGVIKVLDFGIAKIFGESDQNLTKTGTRMGTVNYMSPEQVRGEKPDERSDIYSLGVMLFNLSTGRLPFHGSNSEFEIYNQIVNHPLPAASSVYPGVPASIEKLIRVATEKNPKLRFQNCDDFRKGREPGSAEPVPRQRSGSGSSSDQQQAKTVVDVRNQPARHSGVSAPQSVAQSVANSGSQVQQHGNSAETKKIEGYDMVGLPLHIFMSIVFVVSVIYINSLSRNDDLGVSPIIALITGAGLPLMIGSIGIRSGGFWGVIVSRVFLILQIAFSSVILVAILSTLASPISIIPGRFLLGLLCCALAIIHAIWGLKSVFSGGAKNYFK